MNRPRITKGVLNGILTATRFVEADGYQAFENDAGTTKDIEAAQGWALLMLRWLDRYKGPEPEEL